MTFAIINRKSLFKNIRTFLRWQGCAFEIKLGANQIDAVAANLIKIRDEIARDKNGKPPVGLCVLSGLASGAWQRADGVFMAPVTALKN